jgi:8-hydroxy-5-deazaflavin:NADPH oxidoreductase
MQIAVIGAGNVGAVLGRRWAEHSHWVNFGVNAPSDARHDVLRGLARTHVTDVHKAIQESEVVVLAVPWRAAAEIVRGLGPLGERVVIDCTNPVSVTASGVSMIDVPANSGAELLAAQAQGGRFVKTLNQVGANIMANPSLDGATAAMFVAGDDGSAKRIAADLCEDLGFEPHDAGALRNARALEGMALLWIHQAFVGPNNRNFAWSLPKSQTGPD